LAFPPLALAGRARGTALRRSAGFLLAAFFAPFLVEVIFCAMSLSLYVRLRCATCTRRVVSAAEPAQTNTAADAHVAALVSVASQPMPRRCGPAAKPMVWLPKSCARTSTLLPFADRAALVRRCGIASLAICLFQICSRLHHQPHHNTIFTVLEAGAACFFMCCLMKGLSWHLAGQARAQAWNCRRP
jgi:hypothetical protein